MDSIFRVAAMRMNMVAAMLVALLGWSGLAHAERYDNPKALVEAIYAPIQRGEQGTDFSPFYSEALKATFANFAEQEAATAATMGGGAAHKPFNPFIDGDSYLVNDLYIGEPVIIGDDASVTVSYHNFDHPALLNITLTRGPDGWKVDDVASMGTGERWLLSWLLKYDVFGN